jgi:DNA-binding transcriptional ArsR family regulator
MVVGELDLLFHALADGTRRDIIRRVIDAEESVSGLAKHYPMSFAAVQKHVAILERAELVAKVRRGREQVVHGELAGVRKAARLLDAYEELWRHRAAAIERILSEE